MCYAKEIGDAVMLNRLHGGSNGDLVAVNARYHRKNCYAKYFKQNVVAKDRPAETHMILERVIDEYKSVIIGDSQFYSSFVVNHQKQIYRTCRWV